MIDHNPFVRIVLGYAGIFVGQAIAKPLREQPKRLGWTAFLCFILSIVCLKNYNWHSAQFANQVLYAAFLFSIAMFVVLFMKWLEVKLPLGDIKARLLQRFLGQNKSI